MALPRILVLCTFFCAASAAAAADGEAPRVRLQTSAGEIVLQLDAKRAPRTVANFLGYVESGFFDGTLFHRVIPKFMIQGGGFGSGFVRKTTGEPVANEADNGLRNVRGSVAMARTSAPHSATAQFFINTADNPFLDHKAPSARGWGYAVFGTVIEGMDTVDRISAVPTGQRGGHRDVPQSDVVIERATLINGE